MKRWRLSYGVLAICGLLGGLLLFRDRPSDAERVQRANEVLATHSLTDEHEELRDGELSCLIHKSGIYSKPWFKSVYDIRHGWHYRRFSQEEAPINLCVFYDLDTRQLYVYWSYS